MVTIMIVIFLLGVILGIALGGRAIDNLKKERDQWEREAKGYCAQLGEFKMLIRDK